MFYADAKSYNSRWRPHSAEESKTKSSANNKRLIFQIPVVEHSLIWVQLWIQVLKIMKRRRDKTTPYL